MIAFPVLFVAAAMFFQAGREVGVLKEVVRSERQLIVTLDSGEERRVLVSPEVPLVGVAPGQADLSKAAALALEDLAPGDRILIRGARAEGGEFRPRDVVVIRHSDLLRQRDLERDEWRRRGISGRVEAVDLALGQLTVSIPSTPRPELVRLHLTPGASQKRYRPGSARFSDAVPSSLAEIRAGDQIQALGERRSDAFAAERIVSGSFRNFAAVIESLDAAAHLLVIRDLERKRTVRVVIGRETSLRRLSPEDARRVAQEPENFRSILERLPAFRLEELKPADALIVASADVPGDRLPAFTVLSGAESLLARNGAQRSLIGSWNLTLDPTQP
jgi:hypothetical protein